jgi:hypothetical protein
MVSAAEIAASWSDVHEIAPPKNITKRCLRILEPAIDAGRVHTEKICARIYFGPTDREDLRPPAYSSDLMRVEEALRRAVRRFNSAVLTSAVTREVEADPDLTLTSHLSAKYHLPSLVKTGRTRVLPNKRMPKAENYYTLPQGPFWVKAEAEHPLDKRYRTLLQLWKRTGGQPCTTRALRRWAEGQASLRIPNDTVYGWTNALQHLCKAGLIVRITSGSNRPKRWVSGPERFVRWAPAAAWEVLSNAERKRLIGDDRARARLETEGYLPEDPTFLSQAHDLRSLLFIAQEASANTEQDIRRARILRARPLTVTQIRQVAANHPDLTPKKTDLAFALREASRIRRGVRVPTIWRAGRSGNRIYYAPNKSRSAERYIHYIDAVRLADPNPLRRAVAELREAVGLSAALIVPIPGAILAARGIAIAAEADLVRENLSSAANSADLLEEERARVSAQVEHLQRIAADAQAHSAQAQPEAKSEAPVHADMKNIRIDTVDAWEQIEGLAPYMMETPRLLLSRFRLAVPTVSAPTGERDRKGRRMVERHLDRIVFAFYAGARWGGPALASYLGQARIVIGSSRDPRPFRKALSRRSVVAGHAAAAAALGVFDDPISRGALVKYIHAAITEWSHSEKETGAIVRALTAAAYGLAPLPFGGLATVLEEKARAALEKLGKRGDLEPAASTARRTLRAWSESWSRDKLLQL